MNEPASRTIADARPDNWVDRFAPQGWRPFLKLSRADRPIGTWLLLWPCWWSITLAAPAGQGPDLMLVLLFGIGALVMRGAGCTFNDIVDRDIDRQVARTRLRPIPSGQTSARAAVAWLIAQALVGFAILVSFNPLAILLGVASLALIAIYPFAKRFTYWPQAFLGLAFNWGALLGWAAVRGEIGWAPVVLYLGGIAWTLGYDTIYAHQDKDDDALIGVKSTALRLGEATRSWLVLFYGLQTAGAGAAGALAGLAWPFWIGLGLATAQLAWQWARVDIHSSDDCLAKFRSNHLYGALLCAAFLAGKLAA
ncbi:4-hydroxybenzoate octaprenyltransferase [Oceanibacterium hippocampi]|uniref:4-hydroxybenzoate octaprenyltransferase n=1 Tax=Oceanibacterium hippocampi TaxID=745714 RepID=A0A1Y5S7Z6_9PROT|nr:4-hydroxybenzoate octaprenyltransferase [Oceanibacterium hippocampi]SLN33177.1 4-hydroxybenzoate octaprenyltransferase [Oceanibacterium hippocampi]